MVSLPQTFPGLRLFNLPSHNPWPHLIFFLPPGFCFFQNVIELESYSMQPFQTGFFHLFICISDSSMSFHSLVAPSLSALICTPPSGCAVVMYHSPAEGQLGRVTCVFAYPAGDADVSQHENNFFFFLLQ